MSSKKYNEMMWRLIESIEEVFESDEPFVDSEVVIDNILKTIVNLESIWNYDEQLSSKDFENIAMLKVAEYSI